MNKSLIAEGSGPKLTAFLDRLQQEHPILVGGEALGLCILGLCFRAAEATNGLDQRVIESHIAVILEHTAARRSFADAVVNRYSLMMRNNEDPFFTATQREVPMSGDDIAQDIELPDAGKISRKWLDQNFLGRELMYNGVSVTRRR